MIQRNSAVELEFPGYNDLFLGNLENIQANPALFEGEYFYGGRVAGSLGELAMSKRLAQWFDIINNSQVKSRTSQTLVSFKTFGSSKSFFHPFSFKHSALLTTESSFTLIDNGIEKLVTARLKHDESTPQLWNAFVPKGVDIKPGQLEFIEPYFNQTYSDSTNDFLKLIEDKSFDGRWVCFLSKSLRFLNNNTESQVSSSSTGAKIDRSVVEAVQKRGAAGAIVVYPTLADQNIGAHITSYFRDYESKSNTALPELPILSIPLCTVEDYFPEMFRLVNAQQISNTTNASKYELGMAVKELSVAPKQIFSRNVLAELINPDVDPTADVVIINAHYDHIGIDQDRIYSRGKYNERLENGERKTNDLVHPGVIDNLMGTWLLMQMASQFAKQLPVTSKRILFGCFSAEEAGNQGARALLRDFPELKNKTVACVTLDSLGLPGPLIVDGTWRSSTLAKMYDSLLTGQNIDVSRSEALYRLSDGRPFAEHGVPTVLFTSGMNYENFHTPKDDGSDLDKRTFKKHSAIIEEAVRWIVAQPNIEIDLKQPQTSKVKFNSGITIDSDSWLPGVKVVEVSDLPDLPVLSSIQAGSVIVGVNGRKFRNLKNALRILSTSPESWEEVEVVNDIELLG